MTSATTSTDFSASDSAVGYLYQVRLAVFWALERLLDDQEFSAYLETLDDVVFDPDGSPLELLQTKHHRRLPPAAPASWVIGAIFVDALDVAQGERPTVDGLPTVFAVRAPTPVFGRGLASTLKQPVGFLGGDANRLSGARGKPDDITHGSPPSASRIPPRFSRG